jgi:hypothetical protein
MYPRAWGSILLPLVLAAAAVAQPAEEEIRLVLGPAEGDALVAFLQGPGAGMEVGLDPRTGAVRSLRGKSEPILEVVDPRRESLALELALTFLAEHGEMFGLAGMPGELVLQDEFESPGARHVRYRQQHVGIEVHLAYLYLHFDRAGRLRWADATLATGAADGEWRSAPDEALSMTRLLAKASGSLPGTQDRVERVWRNEAGDLQPTWKVHTSSLSPLGHFEGLVDAATGQLLSVRNCLRFPPGTGLVFEPNPVQVLQDPGLTNQSDACYTEMQTARSSVVLDRLDGSGYLQGQWVSTSASSVARASEPSLDFNYCRDTSFFSEVMCYYHIDTQQEWVQSLGFTNVNNRVQVVDPYLSCGSPNAFYDPLNKRISYCRDGIDSSEDAEVILHEYGHAVQDDQVPGWGMCHEGGSMGEGFGDYWPLVRFTGPPGSFQYGELADWFGLNSSSPSTPGTGLRTADNSKIYPRDIEGEVHVDGEIWSGALFDIYEQLGRTITDSLVLQSHFLVSPGADFMDGGNAIILADDLLYASAHVSLLESILNARGVYYPEDSFEPNDSRAAARMLACGHNGPLVLALYDDDWFTFELQGDGGWFTFSYLGASPAGSGTCGIIPYEVELEGPGGGAVTLDPAGGVNLRADLFQAATGTYTVHVYGNSGSRFPYDLDYVPVNDGTAVFSGLCGDCNGDGQLNIVDALVAAQSAAGLFLPPSLERCDVNSSTAVDIVDALLMAQAAAGLAPTLSCTGGLCGQGNAIDIRCGDTASDSIPVGTAPLGLELTMAGATHHYRLAGIPPGTTSLTITTTGTGDIDLLVGRPGTIPGATSPGRYPTSSDMRSTGPTSTESVILTGSTIYTPADWHQGPMAIAVTAFTAGSYTLTVTCN